MERTEPSQRFLFAGLIVSVGAHALIWMGAAGFVRISPAKADRPPHRRPAVVQKVEKPVIKLGIDDSKFSGLAWLGFKEETPHQALPATVEQAAMTPAPGAPTPPQAQAAPSMPRPSSIPKITSRQVQEAAQSLANIGARLSDAIKAAPVPPQPADTSESAAAAQTAGGGASGDAGLNADKEAIGTSIKNAAQVKLGQVAAANGLDIQTKSPRWSTTTLLMRSPANPTIQITFGKDGKVIRASFASDGRRTFSTGSAEVDEPLLSAVYLWVARGKRLAELTSQDPNGEVTIMITVMLTG